MGSMAMAIGMRSHIGNRQQWQALKTSPWGHFLGFWASKWVHSGVAMGQTSCVPRCTRGVCISMQICSLDHWSRGRTRGPEKTKNAVLPKKKSSEEQKFIHDTTRVVIGKAGRWTKGGVCVPSRQIGIQNIQLSEMGRNPAEHSVTKASAMAGGGRKGPLGRTSGLLRPPQALCLSNGSVWELLSADKHQLPSLLRGQRLRIPILIRIPHPPKEAFCPSVTVKKGT